MLLNYLLVVLLVFLSTLMLFSAKQERNDKLGMKN